MLIRTASNIHPSEITDRSVYLRRREFMLGAATLGAAAMLPWNAVASPLAVTKSPFSTDETQTPLKDVTSYNN